MKTKLISFLSIVALFYGCSSDDDNNITPPSGEEFIGTWQLTAITVSNAIDANNDGNTSTNLLDEVACLQETFILNEGFTWTSNAVNVRLISAITGDLYNVSCTDSEATNGNWGVQNGRIFLVGGNTTREFAVAGNEIIETIGQDLPGIQSFSFQRLE